MSLWKQLFGKKDSDASKAELGEATAIPPATLASAPAAKADPPEPPAAQSATTTLTNSETAPTMVNRRIRVFISSTFRDMMRERDLLVKEVFPELRHKCAKRFVTFTEVDLRWGITEAQANEGQVLPLCLAEIERSRPYFIGLLGERYGWIPDTIRPEVIAREPWLREHVQGRTSVTELEILHGVLNNPKMQHHAFFYFRDPAYANDLALTDDERWDAVEHDIKADVERYGPAKATRLTEERKAKLAALKQRIRDSKLPLAETYADPKALAEIVRLQFDKLIDDLYPEDKTPDLLAQERMAHEAHAKNKLFACIDRPAHLAALNTFAAPAEHDGQGLVITGESGGGKTALLAAWARDWAKNYPEDFLFQHYFGATPDSASPEGFLHRLFGELRSRFGITDDIPSDPKKLRDALPVWLAQTTGKSRIVLVLDGLNQVQGSEPDRQLLFLPRHFPPHVVALASALPGPTLDALRERGWAEHDLPHVSEAEVDDIVGEYLKIHARTLEPELRQQLVAAPGAKNPLFLHTVLEELRQFGSFERLPQRVRHYLEVDNPKDLFLRVLTRWQEDFDSKDPERDKPKFDLVRRALTHLWAARQGLSESEWLDLLGSSLNPQPSTSNNSPLPRALWTPLFLALEPHLSQHAGLFVFGHDYLRQAVQAEFLPTEADSTASRLTLADYFEKQHASRRKAAELPWLLHQLGEWSRLGTALQDPQLLEFTFEANSFDVVAWWHSVDNRSPLKLKNAYARLLQDPFSHLQTLPTLCRLFCMTGNLDEALAVAQSLERAASDAADERAMVEALKLLGKVEGYRGNLTSALEVTKRLARLCRDLQDRYNLHVALAEIAKLQVKLGLLDDALACCSEELAICKGLENDRLIAYARNNMAFVLLYLRRPAEALEIQRQLESRARRLGLPWELALSLGQQANILMNVNELDAALRAVDEQQILLRRLRDYALLDGAIIHQAKILRMLGRLKDALTVWEDLISLYRSLGIPSVVACAEDNQALIYKDLGEFERALSLHESAEIYYRAHAAKYELAKSLVNKAILLYQKLHRLDPARVTAEEAIELWRTIGATGSLRNATALHATILREMGD